MKYTPEAIKEGGEFIKSFTLSSSELCILCCLFKEPREFSTLKQDLIESHVQSMRYPRLGAILREMKKKNLVRLVSSFGGDSFYGITQKGLFILDHEIHTIKNCIRRGKEKKWSISK